MEKVKIYAVAEASCCDEWDNEWEADVGITEIIVEDLLRPASQFNSFEDLIGRRIEHVEYKDEAVILTIE